MAWERGDCHISDTTTQSSVASIETELSTEELEFSCTERFSQGVRDHGVRVYIDHVHAIVFDEFSDEVVADVDVFESSVVSRVDCQKYSSLIVGHKGSGTSLRVTNLTL